MRWIQNKANELVPRSLLTVALVVYFLGSAVMWVVQLIDALNQGWEWVDEFAFQPVTLPLFVVYLVSGAAVIGIIAVIEPKAKDLLQGKRQRGLPEKLTATPEQEFQEIHGTLRRHYSDGFGINVISAVISPRYRIDANQIHTTLLRLDVPTIPVGIHHAVRQSILLQLIEFSRRSDLIGARGFMEEQSAISQPAESA